MIDIVRISPAFYKMTNISTSIQLFSSIITQVSQSLTYDVPDAEYTKYAIMLKIRKEYEENYGSFDKIPDEQISRMKERIKAQTKGIEFKKFLKVNNIFGIGFLKRITKIIRANNVNYQITDKLVYTDMKVSYDYERDYQRDGVEAFFNNNNYGIIKSPTGSGKTFIALATIKEFLNVNPNIKVFWVLKNILAVQKDVPADIKLHAPQLKYQVLKNGIKLKPETTLFLTTVQHLATIKRQAGDNIKPAREMLKFISNSVEFLIVDESHSFNTSIRKSLLFMFKQAYSRMFLSATPVPINNELKKFQVLETQKKILYEIPEETLVEQGHLAERKVLFINVYSNNVVERKFASTSAFSRYWNEYIVKDKTRNKVIAALHGQLTALGLRVVYLTRLIEQCEHLSKMLGIPYISGKSKLSERKKAIRNFVKYGSNFIASGIFNDAINIPEMQVFVNCSGGKSPEMQIQRKGRVIRKSKDNSKKMYIDFVDWGNSYFEDHTYNRILAMEQTVDKRHIECLNLKDVNKFLKTYYKTKS